MRTSLRETLDKGETLVVPGVGDALTAMLVEQAGFECVYMSGYQVSAIHGYPDVGLVTLSEMVAQAARICASVSGPVIADGDNGHGGVANVVRTVREFEMAGVSAIHLEDQALPKKCGHMQGHVLVPIPEMCAKVAAALDARRSRDFLIIARSDAITTLGIEEAIRRGIAYREAGADALMVMAPRSVDDLKRYRDAVDGPLAVTVGSWSFPVTAAELEQIGYQVILYPVSLMRRGITVIRESLAELRATGTLDHAPPTMISMHELHDVLGLKRLLESEARYVDRAAAIAAGRSGS